jgi:hypothetical protein
MKQSLRLLNFKNTDPKYIDVFIEKKFLSETEQKTLFSYVFFSEENNSPLFLPKKINPLVKGTHLWKNTCFECFFFDENSDEYFELNVSPKGEYDLLSFEKYRLKSSKAAPIHVSNFQVERVQNLVTLSFELKTHFKSSYFISPTVILDTPREQSFFALSHELLKPDFHKKIMKFK